MNLKQLIKFLQSTLDNNPQHAETPIHLKNGGEIDGIGFGGGGISLVSSDFRPEHSARSKWETINALLVLAGIPVEQHWELTNQYWPTAYLKLRAEEPWWLVKTPRGLIQIGWRKRVLNIEWDFAEVIVTDDEVTKDARGVHAHTEMKAVEYLKALWGAS